MSTDDDLAITENKAREKVDTLVPDLVSTFGLQKVPIPELTKYVLWAFLGISCVGLFARSDFVNVRPHYP